jgi:hypothetical protein
MDKRETAAGLEPGTEADETCTARCVVGQLVFKRSLSRRLVGNSFIDSIYEAFLGMNQPNPEDIQVQALRVQAMCARKSLTFFQSHPIALV